MEKIDQTWLNQTSTQKVFDVFSAAGFEIFAVGGCVRNALMNIPITDIDLATNARPDQMVDVGKAAGIKVIPTGFDHGTVTFIVDDEPFEITTYRKDVQTDGRHATVIFSQNMADDAARRDFSMNALYADRDGIVSDPLNGFDDLKARRVTFIGNARERITEDYLRILRFFRFFAIYGDPANGIDQDGFAACAALQDGLDRLSKERIGGETIKLLSALDPSVSLASMQSSGIAGRIIAGSDCSAVPLLVHHENSVGLNPNPMRRLACLTSDAQQQALALSNRQAKQHEKTAQLARDLPAIHDMAYRHEASISVDAYLVNAALLESDIIHHDIQKIEHSAIQVMPVKAADLMNDFEGVALGQKLKHLEDEWITSHFTLTKEQLLS